jgi:hypothetical protein
MGEAKRRERMARFANALATMAQEWPVVTDFMSHTEKYRGRVVHMLVAHDDDCPAVGTGVGCTCNPTIQHRLQPKEI